MRTILWALVLCTVSCTSSHHLVYEAKSRVGDPYRPGVGYQCANFVADVVDEAGYPVPSGKAKARNWLHWGREVPWSLKQPGDVIVLWRGSPGGDSGHILIYVGGGTAVHRSTRGSAVQTVDVDRYKGRVLSVRRPPMRA